jgi:hypothetical protein
VGQTDNGVVLTDAERDRAGRLLRERYANGALTFAEFEAQLEAVVSASTADELHVLLHDLSVGELPARMVGADVGESDLASLERQLAPGEQTYWLGHPHPRSQLSGHDVLQLPLAFAWALFSGIGVFAVPWPYNLPLLLVFVGSLQFLVGRFVFPSRRRRRTLYAVTDRRVISLIRREWFGDRVNEMYLTAIPRITAHRGRSRRGTLLFGDAPRYDELRFLEQTMDDKLTTGVGFYNIEDPETIKTLVEVARQHASIQSSLTPEIADTSTSHSPLKAHS